MRMPRYRDQRTAVRAALALLALLAAESWIGPAVRATRSAARSIRQPNGNRT